MKPSPTGVDFTELARALLGGGLTAQAEKAVRSAIALDGENAAAHGLMALIQRRNGALDAATASYRRVAELGSVEPSFEALYEILAGRRQPRRLRVPGRQAAPFLFLRSFLPTSLHQKLLDSLEGRSRVPSTVGTGSYRPEVRLQSRLEGIGDVRAWFLPLLEAILPEAELRLGLKLSPREEIELKWTVARDGDFFRVHRDDCPPDEKRRLTFVYYFHRTPRRFGGGDLILFDTDLESHVYFPSYFTRIVPEDNSIVLFPTGFAHEVTQVGCRSNLMADARLALNGHVRVGSVVGRA